MRRIRIFFVLLAVLLWVPMALLVRSALQSVALEREDRQQTLAERVFDELERQLHGLEDREAARSFAEFDFYLRSPTQRRISPLAIPPRDPYILGYFEIDPYGVFSSPRIPEPKEPAVAHGDWQPSAQLDREFAKLRDVATRGVRAKQEIVAEVAAEGLQQQPGTTRKAGVARIAGKLKPEPAGMDVVEERVDRYQQAIRSLNRAADSKSNQARKESGRRRVAVFDAPTQSFGMAAKSEFDANDAASGNSRSDDKAIASAASIAPMQSPAPPQPRDGASTRDRRFVEIGPIIGRWVEGDYLVLYRSAILSGRTYRQGLVLDVKRMATWLRDEVLTGSPLESHAQLELASVSSGPSSRLDSSDYSYRHRFYDPFDALSATLSIPVLADTRGAGYLYSISALLVIAGTVGLFALYRMVAVAVAFSERRNDFVAAVSHELKTPLTTIRMYGEMLRDEMVPSEEKRREYYSTITAESERLTRLINNVLEFSRLEQGTREMSLVAGQIGPVVEEAAALLEPHAREQGFLIQVELDAELPAVRFDRDALLQVVFNLVDNGLKYARSASERVITLHCARLDAGVALSVRDHGPGVSAGHLSKIFEPFYRGEKELTRTAKGTGIGLALVKGLAERMGAAVSGRNATDGGFEVLLQFREA